MPSIVNIAGYQFVPLGELPALRQQLLDTCRELDLRGTILLSPEGINLFLAGEAPAVEALLVEVRRIPGLEEFAPKRSLSREQPFRRMLVKIKREIIAFGLPEIEPATRTAPKLAPRELKRWLDDGRPVTLLDTRNEYETQLGTFRNAVTLGIDHFRSFPNAVQQLPAELKQQPIVMFCTGGIRCEKAGAYMEQEGFEKVYQLDGGILKYFEDCGSDHYDGECFVFDRRVGVDTELGESSNTQCFNCQAPVSPADQQDTRYVPGRSCPACYLTDAERMEQTITEREQAIARATNPLPGSQPYDNVRPINIAARFERQTLLETVCTIFPHLPREHWQREFAEGLMLTRERRAVAPEQVVRAGETYLHRLPNTAEPDVNASVRILYEDDALVVINKPAPLPLHPCGRFNRNTLQSLLNTVYAPQKLRPVHRLDANTTGIVVFARTRTHAREIQAAIAAGEIYREYVARIHGHPPGDCFYCDAPIGDSTIHLGAREIDDAGQTARTDFRVLARMPDGTTLIGATPQTGRTNQIRIHLWHLGWPLVGDQTYLPARRLGETQTHAVDDPPLCLHAQRLEFRHPRTRERLTFDCPPPAWAHM